MERLWSSGVEAPWRADPAAALALVGLALLMRGLWFGAAGRPGLVRQGRDADAWIRCFQLAVAGLALLGLAAAWVWQLPWLLAIALSALGEEMVETSRILTAINRSPGRPHARERPRRGVSRRRARRCWLSRASDTFGALKTRLRWGPVVSLNRVVAPCCRPDVP